ncbi:cilia- and flagella-associated protein 58-like [Uloborus diversus]|uniref:cilia- and flagella-associated protein 58-like n=1 Tax=Uloborus diversus TaxID=327109 RepID=UPI0024099D7C|nr:cilia- and flagella-associated protein 58-like [Uloborus diversus]
MQKLEENFEILNERLKEELGKNKKTVKNRLYFAKDLKEKDDVIKELEENMYILKKKMEEMETEIDSYKLKISTHQTKIRALQESHDSTQGYFRQHLKNYTALNAEKEKLDLLLKKKDEDMRTLNGKLVNIINEKEASLQKLLFVENQRQALDLKCNSLKAQSSKLEKEILKLRKEQSLHQSEVSNLVREKELLAKNVMKMEELTEKYKNEFKINENERVTLHKEVKNLQMQVEKQNKVISVLESMKSQLLKDIGDLTKKIEKMNDDICKYEDQEKDMKIKIAVLNNKLSQQLDVADAAILDRKIYCQQYKEAKENQDLLKEKSDILTNYVDELKESLDQRNDEVNDWKNRWKSLDLSQKKLLTKLTKEGQKYASLKGENHCMEQKAHFYLQSIAAQEKDIETLTAKMNEDLMMLRSQLQLQQRTNKELEDKLRQFEVLLKNEKEQYATLENGTKVLHLEMLRLTSEKNALICKVNDLEKLKQSFTYAKQELHKERFKNSALEEAMHQPRNIHRWRMLKGTDPEKYKLIENYQAVQKQLLKKAIEGQKKDEKLSSMTRIVDQLKNITSRHKYFETKCMQQINQKELLREKDDKIKALTFDVNMYESYISKYQSEIASLKEELKKLKMNNFFKQKKISPSR